MKRLWIALGTSTVFLAALLAWAASEPPAPSGPSPLPGFMPPGAMLYIEAKDFSRLLDEWNGSPEKQQWLQSDNYEVFSRSRLFLRLAEAQRQFAAAASLPPDMNLLSQSAGEESALALYDVGNLEFVYITRVPSGTSMQSALWQARSKFEPRSAAGTPFFVHTDPESGRVVALAVTSDYLLVATREDLLAASLDLLAGGGSPNLTTEDWYTQAVSSAGRPGDLRMVLNMKKISVEPHFRSYWIQPNASEMRRYSAAISDLQFGGSIYQEDRVLLASPEGSLPASPTPAEPAASPAGAQAVADLLRLVPGGAGVYRATADPAADESLALLQTKLLSPRASAAPASKLAPGVNLTGGQVGSFADLETRIDQPPVVHLSSADAWSALRGILQAANVQAMLSFDSTGVDADTPFVAIHSAVVLAAGTDWDANSVYAALAGAIEQSATTEQFGSSWKQAGKSPDDYFELDGLLAIRAVVRGRLLIASNDTDAIAEVLARLNSPSAAAPAIFAAGFRHAAEQPDFLRLASALDLANSQASREASEPDAEPPFFSANLASLSRVLSGLDSESVLIRDSPGKTLESVTYRWK